MTTNTMGRSNAILLLLLLLVVGSSIEQCFAKLQCGRNAGGAKCAGGLCCSQYGYCGTTSAYCGTGCQSQCSPGGGSPGTSGRVSDIVTTSLFNTFFNYRLSRGCPANGFYTYASFLQAATAWPSFGTTGSLIARKRELAAFFANAHHETSGGCYKEEIDKSHTYCQPSAKWSCLAGKKYYGRGPLQITWNYNYGQAGKYLGFNGINDPDIVARDATISFKTAIWFWMAPQSPKSSCHAAILNGQGFGKTIKIINGGECTSPNGQAKNARIKYYKSYCQLMGVDPGINLTC